MHDDSNTYFHYKRIKISENNLKFLRKDTLGPEKGRSYRHNSSFIYYNVDDFLFDWFPKKEDWR